MRPMTRTAAAALLVATVGVAGCASSYHYSQISGQRYFRAPIDTYPVSIVRVDGKDNVFRPAAVDPGLRQITVQGPPGAANHIGDERTISLEVAPCTRYYLVAFKPNRLASDFEVKVDYTEPVPGCTPPKAS